MNKMRDGKERDRPFIYSHRWLQVNLESIVLLHTGPKKTSFDAKSGEKRIETSSALRRPPSTWNTCRPTVVQTSWHCLSWKPLIITTKWEVNNQSIVLLSGGGAGL